MKRCGLILLVLAGFFALLAPGLVVSHWSAYGPWLARVVQLFAVRFSPSQPIIAAGTYVLTPGAEVHVTPDCDGFSGIRVFSLLFGIILLLNWARMATSRFILVYLGGVIALWMHNTARIVAAVVHGGETHYGTSEMMIVLLAAGVSLFALRQRRPNPALTPAPASPARTLPR